MKRALRGCVAALTFLAAPLAAGDETDAAAPDAAPSEVEFSLGGSGFYGPISGYVQVPLGGNPGTTSSRRPTLHELGIDDAAFWDVTGRVQWRHFGVFAGYTGLDLSSVGTLSESLVTHGVAFAAGSPFKTSIQLDAGYLGAGWKFDFLEGRLEVSPRIAVTILNFDYSLESPSARAARNYRDGAVQLGADAAYQLGHGFALEVDGGASLPIPHMPQLAAVTGRVAYKMFPEAPVHATVFLGCGERWIDFEDSQEVPNKIHVRSGPLLTGGLTISF